MIDSAALTLLVYAAVALTAFTPALLLVLAILDCKRGELW